MKVGAEGSSGTPMKVKSSHIALRFLYDIMQNCSPSKKNEEENIVLNNTIDFSHDLFLQSVPKIYKMAVIAG